MEGSVIIDQQVDLPTGPAGRWLRVFGLAALLLSLQGLANGFFYENADDLLMDLLLRGITSAGHVADLHLYLHGWSQALAALYGWAPSVPWYGLMLYGTLYLALTVCFWSLEELSRGRLNGWQLAGGQVLFYGLTFFLHAVQINFTRPALLLGAAAGLLLLVPRANGRLPRWPVWGLAGLALALAWGLRPAGGLLGLGLTVPLALWLGWGRALRVAGFVGGGVLLCTFLAGLNDTAETEVYRRNDLERARLFDHVSGRLEIHTPIDSLAYQTLIPYWGINDSVLLNPAFFQRVTRPSVNQDFLTNVYGKALFTAVGSLLLRMSGCLLVVLGGWLLVASGVRRGRLRLRSWPVAAFGLYQVGFWLLFLGLVSHLPLRVLQPVVTIYTIVNLGLVFGCLLPEDGVLALLPRWPQRALLAAGLAVGGIWLVVNFRLLRTLRQENTEHRTYLGRLAQEAGSGLLIEQGLYNAYNHLSPLRPYHFGHYRNVMVLAGWIAFDPSQPRLRQALAGTRDLPTALLRLGHRPDTHWVLEPAFAKMLAHYLNARLALPTDQQAHFELVPDSQLPTPNSTPSRLFRLYQGAAPAN